jgi:single-strand DNA-binding protein
MSSFCEIILVGNVGGDPELRFTQSGMAVCSFSIAVNRNRKQGEEWVGETTWFRITVWGQQAETVNQYVQKGRQVLVVGDRIEARAYMTNKNELRTTMEVTARTVRLLGSRGEGAAENGGYQDQGGYQDAPTDSDDIPF